jgi:hypothetical protein
MCCADFQEGTSSDYEGAAFSFGDGSVATTISWLWTAYEHSREAVREMGGEWFVPIVGIDVANYETVDGEEKIGGTLASPGGISPKTLLELLRQRRHHGAVHV